MDPEIRMIENGSLTSLPTVEWKELVLSAIERGRKRLDFMSQDHHSIRRTAVTELIRTRQTVSPEALAHRLAIPVPRTIEILDELERHLFFLVRNSSGAVSWAFPVTIDKTPHKLTFSTGERLYGA